MGAHHPIDANVTWAMDFQFDTTSDGRILKLLNIIDEYSATLVDRSIDAEGVISALDGIVAERGAPVYIRMDNGYEFISHALECWAKEMGVTLYFIDPGSPPYPANVYGRALHLGHRGIVVDQQLSRDLQRDPTA